MRGACAKIGALACIFFLIFFFNGCSKKPTAFEGNTKAEKIAEEIMAVENVMNMANRDMLERPSFSSSEAPRPPDGPPGRPQTKEIGIPGTDKTVTVPEGAYTPVPPEGATLTIGETPSETQ